MGSNSSSIYRCTCIIQAVVLVYRMKLFLKGGAEGLGGLGSNNSKLIL